MAINEDDSWPNDHTLYLAMSGHGKKYAVRRDRLAMKMKRRVIWDPDGDHKNARTYVYTMRDFIEALDAAKVNSFDIAVRLKHPSVETFELFCNAINRKLDGRYRTAIIVEEVWRVSRGPGEATPHWATIIFQSRKFGGVIITTAQRSQRISKDLFTQLGHLYVGSLAHRDAAEVSHDIRMPADDIEALEIGLWYYKQRRKPTIQVDLRKKKALKPASSAS